MQKRLFYAMAGLMMAGLVYLAGCGGSSPTTTNNNAGINIPAAPVITATASTQANVIEWNSVTGATSYNLYWATSAASATAALGTKLTGVTSPYTHSGLTAGTPYYYVATAMNSAGESGPSSVASVTPLAPPCADADSDGYTDAACGGNDCNDNNNAIHPGAGETCNGIDDNCDGTPDENNPGGGTSCSTDQLGVCSAGTTVCQSGALTCSRNTAPSAEVCNGLDDNCNGTTDEGLTNTYYRDADGDTYGGTTSTLACSAGAGYVASSNDCNDNNAAVHPGATETCNAIDDNCDGNIDEGFGLVTCGVGACAQSTWSCNAGQTQTCTPGTPSAEICNGIDDNCNGQTDEAVAQSCYTGPAGTNNVGACRGGTQSCSSGMWGTCTGQVLPSTETCNGVDDDCDGTVDDGVCLNNGSACTTNSQCGSNFCVDGVCCSTACNGTCEACTITKNGVANGSCSPIPMGTDPDAECAGALMCSGTGVCQ